MINKIICMINNLKIRNKILFFYLTLIIISILLSTFIYNRTNTYYLNKKITELTIKEIETNNHSLELLIKDINNYSMTLIANQTVQWELSEDNTINIWYNGLDREIAKFISFNNKISSIYIFRNDGKKYYSEKAKLKNIQLKDIQKTTWYNELTSKNGGFMLSVNANGLINEENKNYLTFTRVINMLGSQEPIGIMMINISEDIIKDTLGLQDQKDSMFVLQSISSNNTIIFNELDNINYYNYLESLLVKDLLWDTERYNNRQIVVTGINNNKYDWRLLKITPIDSTSTQITIYKLAILAIIALNCILVFLGSLFISRYITNPINKLIESMNEVEKGNFNTVKIENPNDEIGILQHGYNFMICEIQKLIKRIIKEQKTLKKAEFLVIMQQIKPHFLYNTLDSISSLIILDRSDEAFKGLRALSGFYRSSLSDGKNIITLKTELQIVKDYLYIQKIRYGDLFTVSYDIDSEALEIRVPKLILQPLVENSIYHGIRSLGYNGHIKVSVKKQDTYVILSVEDNGIGMSEEIIKTLSCNSDNSIGIPATKGRIKTLYGDNSQFIINSKLNCGTKITIKIPLEVDINE